MPESAEVKITTEFIDRVLKHKNWNNGVNYHGPSGGRYIKNPPKGYHSIPSHFTIKEVNCKGKFIYFICHSHTLNKDFYIFNTLGMSGFWSSEPLKHHCYFFKLGEKDLYFIDQRHFGTLYFTYDKRELDKKLNSLGIDLFYPLTTGSVLQIYNKIKESQKTIAELLLDQSIFCGVGNYIRAEALYLAKISPFRIGYMMSMEEVHLLSFMCHQVIQTSYQSQVASFKDFKDNEGEKSGKYQMNFQVYGKKFDPHGNLVTSQDLNGRRIHWVPQIQL